MSKQTVFRLHPQLKQDTFPIFENKDYYLGLHHNALIPWLILVPKTQETELFNCKAPFKQKIQQLTDELAHNAQTHFNADKMNIATIGNMVPQLHIHIIARFIDDFAWPNPIWGYAIPDDKQIKSIYEIEKKQAIIQHFKTILKTFRH